MKKLNLKDFRINKYKAKRITKYIIVVVIILVAILLFPSTLSMYSSEAESVTDVDVAFSLLNLTKLSETIRLDNLIPNDEEIEKTIQVSNFIVDEDGNKKLIDVNMKYTITFKTTTNLPIFFRIEDSDGNELAVSDNEEFIDTDDYGTYWFSYTTQDYYATFNSDSVKTYHLYYSLPSMYNTDEYQDISDLVIISVNAEQVV